MHVQADAEGDDDGLDADAGDVEDVLGAAERGGGDGARAEAGVHGRAGGMLLVLLRDDATEAC